MREYERLFAKENAEKQIVANKKKKSGMLTDSRDGKTYRTIKIGSQVWMAENLNYESKGSQVWMIENFGEKTYCSEDKPANCSKFGRLYTWAAAMDSVGEFSKGGKGCGVASDSEKSACDGVDWDYLFSHDDPETQEALEALKAKGCISD